MNHQKHNNFVQSKVLKKNNNKKKEWNPMKNQKDKQNDEDYTDADILLTFE